MKQILCRCGKLYWPNQSWLHEQCKLMPAVVAAPDLPAQGVSVDPAVGQKVLERSLPKIAPRVKPVVVDADKIKALQERAAAGAVTRSSEQKKRFVGPDGKFDRKAYQRWYMGERRKQAAENKGKK